ADQAGIRAGLRSAHMAIAAGFDVKIPTFPEGKDPADVARENPELLKAAIRTSQPAVEFFLTALRLSARDERAYGKLVEASVLPLIAAMESTIEQEQSARAVANKLGVSEGAVRAGVARAGKGAPQETQADPSPGAHADGAESISGFDRKAAMLLFRFGRESETGRKLEELLGTQRLAQLEESLAPRAEDLRFMFDREVIEGVSEEAIAADMLSAIEAVVVRERLRMKFV
ncbi:MAG TPA: hypothetical protein VHD37_00725, partial [Candidatus Paceibacterota bacterium]|nr:hypothetical protein [Candidatus Paceibacterota bacterium]